MSQQPGDARTGFASPPGARSGRRRKSSTYASTLEQQARRRARSQRRFIKHLTFVLGFTLFLFFIDVASGGGWWFYWWPIGWSIFLIGHALRLYGPQNRFDDDWEDRKTQELISRQQRPTPPAASGSKSASGSSKSEMPSLIASGGLAVATMRVDAVRITKPVVQAQALRICNRADEALKALAEPNRDVQLAQEFVVRVLPAAQTVFSSYVRLSERQISSAGPALARVETHDLPLIERTLDDIYQQLHRHDVVSLEVASEMLILGKPVDITAS
jgi:hypothetical protein